MSAADTALISGMLVAHGSGIEPDCIAKPEWIGVMFRAVFVEQFPHGSEDRFGVKSVPVELAWIGHDDLVGEDGPKDVKVHRDREIPTIDDAGIHIEIGDHADHLFLETAEAG